jgi:hypothetical protein
MNVNGQPSLLTILNEKGNEDSNIPKMISILREVSDLKEYQDYSMADPNWKMPEQDKALSGQEITK